MPNNQSKKTLHYLFIVIVLWRGIYGAAEVFLGTMLFFTASLAHIAHMLVQGELTEDPTDIVAHFVGPWIDALLAHGASFVALYLIAYGLVKIFLAFGLLRCKLWTYPIAIALFSLFIAYQLYRVAHTHSEVLFIVTLIDILATLLIWHEYVSLTNRKPQNR